MSDNTRELSCGHDRLEYGLLIAPDVKLLLCRFCFAALQHHILEMLKTIQIRSK